MEKLQVLVIGGGASGLMAAITAARQGAAVTLLEQMKKPGRKLLMTGNGRCNLTNLDPQLPSAYIAAPGPQSFSEESPLSDIFKAFDPHDTISFFEELGAPARSQDGLVYPRSGQALTVLTALLKELEHLQVRMKYNAKVLSLSRSENSGKWLVKTDTWTYSSDRVILCCGSKAAPQTGSDGSGYALAAMAGHTVTPVLPALTGLICSAGEHAPLSLAAGARSKAKLSLFYKGQLLKKESGELQWTDYGISGIAAFQLSRFAAKEMLQEGETAASDKKGGVRFSFPMMLIADLVPDQTQEEVCAALSRMLEHRDGRISEKELFGSYVHERAAAFLSRLLPEGKPGPDISLIAGLLKGVKLKVTGLRGYDQAQVCTGGIPLAQINLRTLESRIAPGLYFAGEMLDVDGPCGGYNLQWAWSSGFTAGKKSAASF